MKKNTQKLGNPAVASAVSSYVASNPKAIEKTAKVGFWITLGTVVVVGCMAYYGLYYKHRFKKMKFDPASAPSSISQIEAQNRADNLYRALKGVGTDNEAVIQNFKGVNKNGFIAIYNAFGKREPASIAEKFGFSFLYYKDFLNLVQYLKNDLRAKQLTQIRQMVGNIDTIL